MTQPLSEKQKARLKILEPKLETAINNRDYATAKSIVFDIQGLLRPTLHFVRLSQSKNKLLELAIELNDFDFAINALLSNKQILSPNTRVYLETISLLAICYIRMQDIEKAKPVIKEVLSNHVVIKTERTRRIFHSEIIERFNEEIALSSLRSLNTPEYDEELLEKEVIRIIQNLSEQEIYEAIGQAAPRSTKELIFLVYDFSTKQLPSAERLALPSPAEKTESAVVGLTIFQSVKRVIHKSLCDPESEIYKAWYSNGMKNVLTKGYIITAVSSCLINLHVGIPLIASSVIALIMKF